MATHQELGTKVGLAVFWAELWASLWTVLTVSTAMPCSARSPAAATLSISTEQKHTQTFLPTNC